MNNALKIIFIVPLFASFQLAIGQDINFDDLQRPGPALVQSKSISGLVSEGNSYMRQFSETDSARIEARRQASASYSSSSSSSGSNSGAPWTIISSKSISMHGWIRESRVKCLKGQSYKIGSEHTIWTRNDGGVEVSVGIGSIKQNNFTKGANFACGIDD